MAQNAGDVRPAWVSERLYPFESRFFAAQGGRIHYVYYVARPRAR